MIYQKFLFHVSATTNKACYDQEFLDTWYSKLKTFSLTLMKDIVAHCDKTIVKTEDNIKDTETHLKNITEREEYQSVDKTIQNNEANSYNKESSKSSII